MFLVKSAFWLTAAFIVMHPHNVDLGATARTLSGQAVAAGQRVVVAQLLSHECALVSCATPSAPPAVMANANPLPTVGTPMQDSPTSSVAPVPRPRPGWLG